MGEGKGTNRQKSVGLEEDRRPETFRTSGRTRKDYARASRRQRGEITTGNRVEFSDEIGQTEERRPEAVSRGSRAGSAENPQGKPARSQADRRRSKIQGKTDEQHAKGIDRPIGTGGTNARGEGVHRMASRGSGRRWWRRRRRR